MTSGIGAAINVNGFRDRGVRLFWMIALVLSAVSVCSAFIVSANRVSSDQEAIIDEIQEEGLRYAIVAKHEDADYGDRLVIDRLDASGGWVRVYENDFKDLKPWRIEIADIDGDLRKEVLIAVNKTTHYDPETKNRMFIFNYDYDGAKLVKKWTGSQLSGDWKTFYAGDLLSIPGDELIFIERMEANKERIGVYYWFDFGFVHVAESELYDPIEQLAIVGPGKVEIRTTRAGEPITLTVKSGKLMETKI